MPLYSYTARDSGGRLVSGSFDASSRAEAAAYVRSQGLYITKLSIPNQWAVLAGNCLGGGVSRRDLAIFCRLFAVMLSAGLPIHATLTVLIEQTANRRLREATRQVFARVQEGKPLGGSFSEQPRIFPAVMLSMLKAGELGGSLDSVLTRLAIQFENEHRLEEKIKSALAYPLVVIVMTLLAVGFLLIFVLPVFVRLFVTFQLELPLLTRLLLAAGAWVQVYWPLLLLLTAGSAALFFYWEKQPSFHRWIDPLLLRLPLVGLLLHKLAIARFSRTLGSLLRGGVPVLQAIEVVKYAAVNQAIVQALSRTQNGICQGIELAVALKASGMFPPLVVQMIAIGEATGALDSMLDKIADFYESDVDAMAGRLSSMLEPLVIGILGLLIGLIVFAVLLPIMDAISGAALR
ncbi:MAG: type II secretion system F family protein [Sporomusaceae bacterium]|nr:type II secretion system F family protein [Sporomusaceae bacterium]